MLQLHKFIKKAGIVTLMGTCLYAQFAMASWNNYMPQPLMRSDLTMMRKIARVEIVDKEIGTVLDWNNKETGLKGTVKLVRKFDIKDIYQCHEVEHDITFKNSDIVRFNSTLCIDKKGKVNSLPFTFPNKK